MILDLTLPSDQQAELERRAAAAGVAPAEFVLRVVQEQLHESDDSVSSKMNSEQWTQRFREWIDGQRSRNPRFDDSRESIYR